MTTKTKTVAKKAAKAATVSADKPAKAKAIVLLVGAKAIETALTSIHKRGAALQHDTHVAACSILKHIGEHSDVRLIDTLLAAVPDMTRRNAIRDWFTAFGPVTFENNKPVFQREGKTRLGDAMAKPFWTFSPEKFYVPLVLADFMASMVRKLEKDAKETNTDHSALIASLSKLTPANTLAA